MKQEKIVFYLYNRLQDPLVASNIMLYIQALNTPGVHRYDIVLITYEDSAFPIDPQEKAQLLATFAALNISWHPLKWHSGMSLKTKLRDLFSGFSRLLYLRLFRNYLNVVTLGSIAGSYAYLISRLVPFRYYLYQYEPHSEFAVDSGIWQPTGRQFKLLNRAERKSAQNAAVISTGTDAMIRRLRDWKVQAAIFKITSVANEERFRFSALERVRIREELNISDTETCIIYPGKLNDLYCSPEQLLDVFRGIHETISRAVFIVLSPNSGEVDALLNSDPRFGNMIVITRNAVAQELLPGYLSAADFGFVAITPTPAQQFRSPIKVGEYLANGLPYIVCRGVSEDGEYAEENNVGIVLESFDAAAVKSAAPQFMQRISEDREVVRARCRKKGADYRGFQKQSAIFLKALETLALRRHSS